MKYLYLLPASLLLASCDAFSLWTRTPISPDGPTPADIIGDAGPAIIQDAATGNYVGAAIGAGGVIATLLGWKGYQKARASGPGSLGIFARDDAS